MYHPTPNILQFSLLVAWFAFLHSKLLGGWYALPHLRKLLGVVFLFGAAFWSCLGVLKGHDCVPSLHSVCTCWHRPEWSVPCCIPINLALSYSVCYHSFHKTSQKEKRLTARFIGRKIAALLATDVLHACMQLWRHTSANEALGCCKVSGRVEQGSHPRPIRTHCPGGPTHTRGLLFFFTT